MATAAPTPLRTARVIAADIKLSHSVFALPFAVLAAFMAAAPLGRAILWSRFSGQLALVVAAMVFARTVAMLANRLLDRNIDKDNPRTTARALPSGRLSVPMALGALLGCSTGFMALCLAFGVLYGNWWPAGLGLPVLAWLSLYPLLKRFTSLSHLYLGSSLAIS
ncbi:MAG: UbiA family prenyltransferase, partial [Planctomycetota bacterium]|nr:UbiA family prenyltransferase [Planctomycetota bacterium]